VKIDNGYRAPLSIAGVFEGAAGVQGRFLAFVPNCSDRRPNDAVAGILNGQPVRISPEKDPTGPFWTSAWEPLG
jgi:hypothetical protein